MEKLIANNPFDGKMDATHYYLRSYSRTELARQYIPDLEDSAARKKFNCWLNRDLDLIRDLKALGADSRTRRYTPRQVQVIYERLGLPVTLLPYW